MAYQLSDIVTKVQQRVRDTGYSASEITNYLNDTQNDIFNEYHLRFMRTSINYTATIADADITHAAGVPANFDQAIDLINTTAGSEQTIPYIDINELERLYQDIADTATNPNGAPLYWYWEGTLLKVFPAPAGAYTFKLRYYKKPILLSANGDVPELPSNFEEALVEGASYRVLQVKDNYDQAAVHQNKYEELLQKAVVRYAIPQMGRPTIMGINRSRSVRRSSSNWRR